MTKIIGRRVRAELARGVVEHAEPLDELTEVRGGTTICRSLPASSAAAPSFESSSLKLRMTRRSMAEPGG